MNKDILTQGEAVELMQEIIQKENYKYNLDISFGTVKFTNRLKHELNQNQINLEKGFKKWVKAFDIYEYEKSTRAICFCYHSIRISLVTDKHIVFKFLNDIYKRLDILITSYHEFFHALEDKKFADIKDNDLSTTDINFYTFFSIIETMIKHQPEVVNYYKNNHDDFIREMGADLYAIKQTIDKHNLNSKEKKKLLKMQKDVLNKYNRYNTDCFVDQFFTYYSENWANNRKFDKEIFNVFYSNGHYRNLNEIFKDPRFRLVHSKISEAIILSHSFLNTIDINQLDSESKEYLLNIIQRNIKNLYLIIGNKKRLSNYSIDYCSVKFNNILTKLFKLYYENTYSGKLIINPLLKLTNVKADIFNVKLDKEEEKLMYLIDLQNAIQENYKDNKKHV